jgi:hypothetical protein
MPLHYLIDKNRRLVVSTGRDRVTFAEVTDHHNQLVSNPDFNQNFNQLADITAVTALDVSIDEAKMIAYRHAFSPTSRRAFVASRPDVFGMVRLMQAHHNMGKTSYQIQVFYDRPAALKWLGLPETYSSGSITSRLA